MKVFLFLFWSAALSCMGQGFGGYEDQPFFSGGLPNTNPPPLSLTNLPGALLVVDAHFRVTNTSGSIAGNGDAVQTWGDLTTNVNNLVQLSSPSCPTNFSTGGPTNGPYVYFNQDYMTNYIGGTNVSQPNTLIFVLKGITPVTGGGILNGNPGSVPQWNQATGNGGSYHFFAGNDQEFVNASDAAGLGWPLGSWAIVTFQVNGASSLIRINGTPYPIGGATNYNFGANAFKGITFGSYVGGSLASRDMFIASIVYVSGSYWTTLANLLKLEELLGTEWGISVP